MGKRKGEESSEDHLETGSPHKKSKHKHKKHKKKRERSSSNSEEIDVVSLDMKKEVPMGFGSLKLKIKFGGETVSTSQFVNIKEKNIENQETQAIKGDKLFTESKLKQSGEMNIEDENDDEMGDYEEIEGSEEIVQSHNGDSSLQGLEYDEFGDDLGESVSDVISQDSTTMPEDDDDESKWLDALESGDLDDYGRLKKEKDVSLMTTRQRALYGHLVEGETELVELPTWAKRRDENSEEAQLRRKQRAKKRKQQMQKQIEETKAQTIDKLLNKQAAKIRKETKAANRMKKHGAHIKYTSGPNGTSISLSKGIEFPLQSQSPRDLPIQVKCAVDGCRNLKKYACSRTKLPVCGLDCYKKVQSFDSTVQILN